MAEKIYKVLEDCEVKKVGERQYEFTASTSDIDRDGEVIDVKGWDLKNFKKNPVIMYAHDYSALPVGKASRVWTSADGRLKNTVQFPPEGTYEFADIVERLVDTGYLQTESVGFIPDPNFIVEGDGKKGPRRTYTKQELLEISIVPVPSNPNALRNALDDGVINTKEFEAIIKTEEVTQEVIEDVEIKVDEHVEKLLSQEELKDELDYLKTVLEEIGLSEEAKGVAWELVREVMRLHGNDIPFDIAEKLGAVLNQKNKDRLSQIQTIAQQILDSAEKPQEPEKESVSSEEFVDKLTASAMASLDRLQGKVG